MQNPGYYSVTVTNANGCMTSDNITVSVHGYPSVNLGADKVGCFGDTLQLRSLISYPSGYNFLWTGGLTSIQRETDTTGTFVLNVTNNFMCAKSDTILVTISSPPTLNLIPLVTACGDTTIRTGRFAGATYLWNTNSTSDSIQVNSSGTYIVQVSIGSCSSKDTSVVTINPRPVVNLGADLMTCATNPPTLDAGNFGSKYLWSSNDTSKSILADSSKNYWSKVTNTFGCSYTDSVLVTLTDGPSDSLGPDINTCWEGKAIVLNAGNPGSSYKWNTGANSKTINVSTSRTYSVTVTDQSNCRDTAYIDVTLKPIPEVNLGTDRSVCDSIQLDVKNAGSSYLWSDASTDRLYKIRSTGTYWVKVTNPQNCISSDTVQITISDGPVVNLGADTIVCSGNELIYKTNQSGVSILWSNNSSVDSLSIQGAGEYWLKLTDSSGCANADTINISLGTIPGIDLGNDTTLCSNQLFPLEVDSGHAKYSWTGPNNFTNSVRKVDVQSSGIYTVEVVSQEGCRTMDSINLLLTHDTVMARFLMPSSAEIGDSITMVDLSSSNVKSWLYNFGDNTSSTSRDPLKIYVIEDTFRVSLTVSNGICIDQMSKTITIKKELKTKEKEKIEIVPDDVISIVSAKVYPNPNNGIFTFDLSLSHADDFIVYFFNMSGSIISQERHKDLSILSKKYSFGNLPDGIYFLKVITASQQTETFKIVIND